jgi:hypothetical protein
VQEQFSQVQLEQFPPLQPSQLHVQSVFFILFVFNVHLIDLQITKKMQENSITYFTI